MASHNAAPTATLTDTAGASPYIMTLTGKRHNIFYYFN